MQWLPLLDSSLLCSVGVRADSVLTAFCLCCSCVLLNPTVAPEKSIHLSSVLYGNNLNHFQQGWQELCPKNPPILLVASMSQTVPSSATRTVMFE